MKHKRSHNSESKREEKKHSKRRNSSESSDSDEWVEKKTEYKERRENTSRDDWMSMTGVMKTYTKDDIRTKKEKKEKDHIDSYNPSTSSRELNPYWKDGGSGVPQTPESYQKSRQFLKPSNDDDYYSSSRKDYKHETSKHTESSVNKSFNWRKITKDNKDQEDISQNLCEVSQSTKKASQNLHEIESEKSKTRDKNSLYLSDEKMNKLGAKIIKAEILGDMRLVEELKAKLEAAREYRKNNPDAGKEDNDDRVLLMSSSSNGNYRPLVNNSEKSQNRDNKRKTETHDGSGRIKYFGNDNKYDLAQMFQEEKYGSNYNEDAELAKAATKSKNPNDDLEDIFLDNISKNKNDAKESEREKQRAIKQNVTLERSLEGCNYCFDSRNMLKHLVINCGNRVYMALPVTKSLVRGHCVLSTIQHSSCVTNLDEDIWEEIMNYRKLITQFFNSQNKDVIFYETAVKLNRFPHMVINCVPLPRDVGDMASIYFKKALLECEGEWAMNKKVVDLKGKNIRKCIPKGLPYFWVDFGMEPGFAHVIEDFHLFSRTFAEEIIGGMLDLDHTLWKNPQKEYGDAQRKKVIEFMKDWKPFEQSMKV